MKKFENIILPIIALVLVVAAIVGMVALFKNVDKVFDTENTDTQAADSINGSASSGSSNSSENTAPPAFSTSDAYYIDETNGCGYRTELGITYFFKVIKPIYNGDYEDYNRCVLIESYTDIVQYDNYVIYNYYSTDSFSWKAVTFSEEFGFQEFIPRNGVMYITYTKIENCSDPMYVLQDLAANVFSSANFFKYSVVWAAG